MPCVSVIIPAYNRADLIGETVDSVLAQTHPDIEIIVIDDGSTDNTADVLATYGSALRVIRQANAGQQAARNAGIRAATGDYIAFLDSDDLWLPHRIEAQLQRFEEVPEAGLVYCDAAVFDDETGQTLHKYNDINPPHEGW
ncbi:MAG: glycosyltransferase family 2 protein, partial [Okeania sp. SIO3B3]|nr:glycosyltransferase family 2 protein [Okeania sp. SIO3B3]